MEKMIQEAWNQKLEDGTIEHIISKEMDEAIRAAVQSVLGYSGSVRKQIQERIEPLLCEAVERSDLGEMTVKLTAVIDEALKNSNVSAYQDLLKGIRGIAGCPRVDFQQEVSVEAMFEEYVKFIQSDFDKDDFDEDEIDWDDGVGRAAIECHATICHPSDEAWEFYANGKVMRVEFTNEKDAGRNFAFKLCKGWDNLLVVSTDFQLRLSDLRHMPGFAVYLLMLEQNFAKITLPTEWKQDATAEFEFDEE